MQRYEIVLDGELTGDLPGLGSPIRRRDSGQATILSVSAGDPDALGRTLDLLESLGIGVTAIHQVPDTGQDAGQDAADPS